MALTVGGTPVKSVYVGSAPVTAVYVGAEKIWPTIEVHEVSLTDVRGDGVIHPLLTVTVPAGETWNVRIQGTMTKAYGSGTSRPRIQIGGTTSAYFSEGATVDITGTITSSSATIALLTSTDSDRRLASFTGTVTIEK